VRDENNLRVGKHTILSRTLDRFGKKP
jgi:hypothetical protein